jgi:C1A family cysteine protease
MTNTLTVGELRQRLAQTNASWTVNPSLKDEDPVPQYPAGAEKHTPSAEELLTETKFQQILSEPIANPFLMQRRMDLGFIAPVHISNLVSELTAQEMADAVGGARPPSVDWRNRWGWNWITSIQNQGCQDCWAFTSTALIEAMLRIEHAVWSKRAEVEMRKGVGKTCADYGNCAEALNWARDNGQSDPGCTPYTSDNNPLVFCADRSGRTVKIPNHSRISDIEAAKRWIDAVGPVASWLRIYNDFGAVGDGIYRVSPGAVQVGAHFVLIVGYNDNQGCWICKNSWGTGFGNNGYCRIAYGETGIDEDPKYALQGTNPDPWTKRRLHNGNMIESGNGTLHRNFEMLATAADSKIRHWWRQGGENGDFSWHQGVTFGNDAMACPTLTATTFNRNFESVHLTTSRRLHHWYFNQASGQWLDGGIFGPMDAVGIPGFIQGNYNAPGNFEVVVRTADSKLNHWWRDGGGWHDGGRFGSNIAFSGASLVQSRYGNHGNLELVCVNRNGQMQHWWRDDDHGFVWNPGATLGSGVSSPPCMIEGQYGANDENRVGNFELCVAVAGKVQHWWRDNQGNTGWHYSATFGHDVQAVTALVEGSFGFNLEVIVLRTDRRLQHYWRDGAGWHEGPIIGLA